MAFNFEVQKKSARNLVLSINSQLTNNDVFADANLTRRQRFDGSAVMEQLQTRRSDKDMSGKGTEFATDGQMTNYETKFTCKADLDDWLAGYLFAFCMGKDTVTGTGAPYSHAIAWDETTSQAKMTNVYLEDTHDIKTKYPDMAISDVTINYAARGCVTCDWSMGGTGRYTDVAMVSLPAVPTNAYLLNSDTVFSLGPVSGSLVNMTGRFLSATLKLQTQVVNHTAPGGALFGIFMRTGLRKFSLQAKMAAKDTDDVRTLFMNDTPSQMTIVTTSGALPSVLTVTLPNFKLKSNKLGVDGNMVIWEIDVDETTAFTASAISVTVQNSAPAYLTPV